MFILQAVPQSVSGTVSGHFWLVTCFCFRSWRRCFQEGLGTKTIHRPPLNYERLR